MNIGIFGGTFYPPHIGHLIAAEHVREQLGLQRVVFVPACLPPHKREIGLADAHHRMTMVEISVRGNRNLDVSDSEVKRGGVSYTIDTLRAMSTSDPQSKLFLLLGTDMLADFRTWRSPEEILELAEIVALSRPEFPIESIQHSFIRRVTVCRIPEIGVSSSEIRRRVKEGKSIRYMVVPPVESYVREHGLYR